MTVPPMVIISICIANLLNKNIKGKGIYRTIYFLPVVTMASASTLVFQWMFNSRFGLVNQFLEAIGLEGKLWFTDPNLARVVIIVFIIWSGLGYKIMIFLGGLQSIPESYYEAASIDGASSFKQFTHITIPLLTPSIFFIVIWSLIGSFQLFDVVFMLIKQGSPAYESTITMTRYFYDLGFTLGDKGYASAVAVILFLIIMVVTLIQFKLQKKWVHYSDE
ncbi:sugar ABC transporter permease [Paraclostridium benzoelyticum]|uniref:carbohydrate ABC transporter permease n=1 Tax=Paraclostridium benzoelyticum TaxID=1629550 RepID=UPI0031CD02A4